MFSPLNKFLLGGLGGVFLTLALWLSGADAASISDPPEKERLQVEKIARKGLTQFLATVRAARSDFGFSDKADLSSLRLESPIAAYQLDEGKLLLADAPGQVADFLKPSTELWFPVVLDGVWHGIVAVVKAPPNGEWIAQSFGKRRAAIVLQKYRLRYSLPKHELKIILPPGPPEVCLAIEGLGYSNLTWISVGPNADNPLESPPPAKNVLQTLKLKLQPPL